MKNSVFLFSFSIFATTTNWFQFLQISHPRGLQRSVLEHLIALLAAEQCGLMMDALKVQRLVGAAHIVAADVFRENFCAIEAPHRRTQIEE